MSINSKRTMTDPSGEAQGDRVTDTTTAMTMTLTGYYTIDQSMRRTNLNLTPLNPLSVRPAVSLPLYLADVLFSKLPPVAETTVYHSGKEVAGYRKKLLSLHATAYITVQLNGEK